MKKFELSFVQESTRLGEVRPLLNNVEHIFDLAQEEIGLRVFHRHGVQIERALPLNAISEHSDERLKKFVEIRLPQLNQNLENTRQRYAKSLADS